MTEFTLGVDCVVDLVTLIASRLLIQANSGAGKSYLIRRLLEQTFGQVQHIVIDLEGEFSSLRESFDYLVAGKGGDTPADPRTAALLAERLLELKASAIIDIYELKPHERILFVRRFVDALVNAPKELWHPVLIVVDEAHVFCPQSDESESASAIKDLCTRGRKRGFCAVLATQRISKLHKDAAADCNNKLIGRAALDVDMKRAAQELGFTTREQQHSLRTLEPGEFFAFGPALSLEVKKIRVGKVKTTHPKIGDHIGFTAPAPTAKIRAMLAKLADLPAEVDQRAKTLAELQIDNINLRKQLAAKPQPKTTERVIKKPIVQDGQLARLEKIFGKMAEYKAKIEMWSNLATTPLPLADPYYETRLKQNETALFNSRAAQRTLNRPAEPVSKLPGGERKVLSIIAQRNDGASREYLTLATVFKRTSVDAYVQRLVKKGFVQTDGTNVQATPSGYEEIKADVVPLPDGGELRDHWTEKLPPGERTLFTEITARYPGTVDRDTLCEAGHFKRSTVDAYIQRLATRRLVIANRSGVRAVDSLFDKE